MIERLASVADMVSAAAVTGAVIFALIQIRQYREQRRDSAAVELMRTIQSPQWARSLHLLGSVPDGVTARALRDMDSELEEAALTVVAIYETIGLLVFRNIVPFHLVQELTGGTVVVMWRKLSVWAEQSRRDREHDRFAEWFQWLAERFAEHVPPSAAEPAYRRWTTWRPSE
jgi:hypothetical protein